METVISRRASQLRVPEITILFWVIKGLSTAMGEATSDYLVHALPPVLAVGIGFVGFALAMIIQFSMRRYRAWAYWFAVVMVGVFGTMIADVLHVGFGVQYFASAVLFALVLASIFVTWYRVEGTLSIHTVDSTRREAFYWMTVVATFALGTAVGDLTSVALGLGYLGSAVLFAAIITLPALAFGVFHANSVLTFWFAYVITRPLGASIADWLGKTRSEGGIGIGNGAVALVLTAAIAGLVVYLAATRRDVQSLPRQQSLPRME